MARDSIINRWDINGDVYEIQDAGRGHPLGVATLDENGRVPYTQLPESAVEFKGYWDASTNTPTLQDGTGTKGDMYYVDVAGTQNLGSGSQTFRVGDRILYDGSIWKNMNAPTDFQQIFDMMHPIDEVYVQFPTEKSPASLYNRNGIVSVWTDITDTYDGAFFRAYKNGTSGDFFDDGDTLGTKQENQNKSHGHTGSTGGANAYLGNAANPTTTTSFTTTTTAGSFGVDDPPSGWSIHATGFVKHQAASLGGDCIYMNSNDSDGKIVLDHNHTIYQKAHSHSVTINNDGGTEARPDNYAIKVWKRTA